MEIRKNLLLRSFLNMIGLLDISVELFWRTKHLQDEAKYRYYIKSIDRKKVSNEITAVVLTVGENRFVDQCIQSIRMQTLPPIDIKIIKNITPFSKASQKGLESVNTPFYVSVDEDMILNPNCFERLYYYTALDEKCGETVLRLKDPILGRLWGIHMYRVDAVRPIGFHPLTGEKGCERQMNAFLRKNGFRSKHIDLLAGLHHPVYTPKDAFWKYRFIGEKYIYYRDGSGHEILKEGVNRLCEYWLEKQSNLVIYAMAGLIDGIQSDTPSKQLNYQDRDHNIAFAKLNTIFSKKITISTDNKRL